MNTPALLPLHLELTPAGDPARLEAGSLSLLQYPSTPLESGPAGLFVRVGSGPAMRVSGPAAPEAMATGGPVAGQQMRERRLGADGTITCRIGPVRLAARLILNADDTSLSWAYRALNEGAEPVTMDLLHTLDPALTPWEDLRRNEYYVSQYLDITALDLPDGTLAMAVRNNLPSGPHPWLAVGSSAPVDAWGTDALQLVDLARGDGLDPDRDLPSARLQHEHSLVALRTTARTLTPGEQFTGRMWAFVVEDHPGRTTSKDARWVAEEAARHGWEAPSFGADALDGNGREVPTNLFASATALDGDEPTDDDLRWGWLSDAPPPRDEPAREGAPLAGEPGALRHREVGADGHLHAGTVGYAHIVTGAKERAVLRPHGHILTATASAGIEVPSTAATVWMNGIFASQLTYGHACAAPALAPRRSYVGLTRASGVRLLRREPGAEGAWRLLGIPTLWAQMDQSCTWLYRWGTERVLVTSTVRTDGRCDVSVEHTGASDLRAIIVGDTGRLSIDAVHELTRGDAPARPSVLDQHSSAVLFSDGADHAPEVRVIDLGGAGRSTLRITAALPEAMARLATAATPAPGAEPAASHPWRLLTLESGSEQSVAVVSDMLAHLAHDARVHYQTPRGLEQFIGGAWGTRDVSQGPVGLLVATDEPAALREVIVRIFAAQQVDGTWPQWFEYLPGMAEPGNRDSHGDVIYWPLLALADYLATTGDQGILVHEEPLVGPSSFAAPSPILAHVRLALDVIDRHRTADPRLPAYGHGDWNDSLQPAQPDLARHLCSTWSAVLEIHALSSLAPLVRAADAALAQRMLDRAASTRAGVRERLIADGELAGYAIIGDDGHAELLVHPRDTRTGLTHGSLQMIHAIAHELLDPEDARAHAALVQTHLVGPTGLYLFDTPITYRGGETRMFQRAETATFWGREIGLMYTHAHVRWIEALAQLGEGERAWAALLDILPLGLTERSHRAAPRQSTCYFSSSDARFADREEAQSHPERLFEQAEADGDPLLFEGGWRVYSSGPGLILRLVRESILGLRTRADRLEIDPVLPPSLSTLEASVPYADGSLNVSFVLGPLGHGVRRIELPTGTVYDAEDPSATMGDIREVPRAYRPGGVSIPASLLSPGARLVIHTR